MSVEGLIQNLKFKFGVTADTSVITFRRCSVEPYNMTEPNHTFGEKICLIYTIEFTLYNVAFSMIVLCFIYEAHGEVLKLTINIQNDMLAQEMNGCKNYLQRKRNLNLAFDTIIRFVRLFESRRLIHETVLKRQRCITVTRDNNGLVIKCMAPDMILKYFEIYWNIRWNVEKLDISDFIEFYCSELLLGVPTGQSLRLRLTALTQKNDDFQSKLKLWKELLSVVYGSTGQNQNLAPSANTTSNTNTTADDVMEIADSDSDDDAVIIEDPPTVNPPIVKIDSSEEVLLID